MSDAARAKPVLESCLDDDHERADHQVFVVCITCTTNAFAAEQTAALRARVGELTGIIALANNNTAREKEKTAALQNRLNALLADPTGLTAELRGEEGLRGAYTLACEENRKLREQTAAMRRELALSKDTAFWLDCRWKVPAEGPRGAATCGLEGTHVCARCLLADEEGQTAELREENARLRGRYQRLLDAAVVWGRAHTCTAGFPSKEGDESASADVELLEARDALLADPEGQRAGEEWRALDSVHFVSLKMHGPTCSEACGILHDGDRCALGVALAAVERARQAP